MTGMGLTYLVLSWAAFVAAYLTSDHTPKASAALAFAALPLSALAVVGTLVGLILEVTP